MSLMIKAQVSSLPKLRVITYHYVRDFPATRFPRIKGLHTRDFQAQIAALQSRYEMATLESALAFLCGEYLPNRDLCLLTFDDGLKEHFEVVTPILVDYSLQGVFFMITSCPQEQRVASVHMNHLLMASMDFLDYQEKFLRQLEKIAPEAWKSFVMDPAVVKKSYPWDTFEVGSFKYGINFLLDWDTRDQIIESLFKEYIPGGDTISDELYLNWQEASSMQSAGMIIGGHSHQHRTLANLADEALCEDIRTCKRLLIENLNDQFIWPFCYPYGQRHSFHDCTIREVKRSGFACAFTTEVGENFAGADVFSLFRTDCNDALTQGK